ncbi:MAG: hypothetical protein JWR08_1890 [Enterovirga sp.]|nr:hypothetical protein [Enterovirga sp.]
MTNSLRSAAGLLLAAALLGAGAAQAEGVMDPAKMPMPPSARDPAPRSEPKAAPRGAARPRAQGPAAASQRPQGAQTPDYGSRIESRPARSEGFKLEDDPRAVAPVMQNGRPGVGMRF